MSTRSTNSRPEEPTSREERQQMFGTVVGKKPIAVGPPPNPGAAYTLRFKGEHLQRLREGIRDFGIVPDDEFFMGAIMAAIDEREAELGDKKIVDPEHERKIEAALRQQAEWRREIAQRRQDDAVQSAD